MHRVVGWDIGGAHVKAALVEADGGIGRVMQYPCPLWQGMAHLHRVMARVEDEMAAGRCYHAVTMTGELVDFFSSRDQGVAEIVKAAGDRLGRHQLRIFAGTEGLLAADQVTPGHYPAIASANWMASAGYCASRLRSALFVDIGSTTTDILVIGEGRVEALGYTDFERLQSEELVYTGIVRTPVMALADSVPFGGRRVSLAAEYFATMADVYRLWGELPDDADLMPAADGGEKSLEGSRRRLARMVGLDGHEAPDAAWRQLAFWLRERQLGKIQEACQRQLSRHVVKPSAPVVGAGVGRFLVKALAARLCRPYVDWTELFPDCAPGTAEKAADCAPAAAVARLAWQSLGEITPQDTP